MQANQIINAVSARWLAQPCAMNARKVDEAIKQAACLGQSFVDVPYIEMQQDQEALQALGYGLEDWWEDAYAAPNASHLTRISWGIE